MPSRCRTASTRLTVTPRLARRARPRLQAKLFKLLASVPVVFTAHELADLLLLLT